MKLRDPLPILTVSGPARGVVRPPGSKSITNRALVTAALADGRSQLFGVLDSDDTRVMIASLDRLGVSVKHDKAEAVAVVEGCGGRPPAEQAELWLDGSGTSMRFLAAVSTLGRGSYRLDGNDRMRQRPIGDLVAALNALGGNVTCENDTGCPPLVVHADGLRGGTARVPGRISSQYLSALLLAGPCSVLPVQLEVDGTLVSRPYVEMTLALMSAFGVDVDVHGNRFQIEPQRYRARRYMVEPDASAASYFFALAAITGGEITVEGLPRDSLQGDVAFLNVLEQMGCTVKYEEDQITVYGGALRGVDVDMNAISDTVQTLAAVAVFAEGPTRIRNVEHIRYKETDRIEAVATELRRLGAEVDAQRDSLVIHPKDLHGGVVETYNDHRMAMSFSLIGLRVPGVRIADAGCTAKTYPRFFDDLQKVCGQPS